MKRSALSLLVLLLFVFTGCDSDSGSDDSDALSLSDFTGSWTASSHTYKSQANASMVVDIIALGGETRMTVLNGGGARTWVELGTFSDEWDAQLSLSGNTLTSTPAESSRPTVTYTVSKSGNTITLTDTSNAFDFTLSDATPTAATMVVVLVKQ